MKTAVVLNGYDVIREALVKMADNFSDRGHNFIQKYAWENKGKSVKFVITIDQKVVYESRSVFGPTHTGLYICVPEWNIGSGGGLRVFKRVKLISYQVNYAQPIPVLKYNLRKVRGVKKIITK
jgi:hypothetical protein